MFVVMIILLTKEAKSKDLNLSFLMLNALKCSKSYLSRIASKNAGEARCDMLYVDGIIVIASSNELRQSIMSLLSFEFAKKNLGRVNYF